MKQFNLDEYLVKPSRKVVTRNGRNVKIIYTDKKGDYPIIALIESQPDYEEVVGTYTRNGCWCLSGADSINDLFFAPEKHEGWVNVYRNSGPLGMNCGSIFKSEEEARRSGTPAAVATVKIEWEE